MYEGWLPETMIKTTNQAPNPRNRFMKPYVEMSDEKTLTNIARNQNVKNMTAFRLETRCQWKKIKLFSFCWSDFVILKDCQPFGTFSGKKNCWVACSTKHHQRKPCCPGNTYFGSGPKKRYKLYLGEILQSWESRNLKRKFRKCFAFFRSSLGFFVLVTTPRPQTWQVSSQAKSVSSCG